MGSHFIATHARPRLQPRLFCQRHVGVFQSTPSRMPPHHHLRTIRQVLHQLRQRGSGWIQAHVVRTVARRGKHVKRHLFASVMFQQPIVGVVRVLHPPPVDLEPLLNQSPASQPKVTHLQQQRFQTGPSLVLERHVHVKGPVADQGLRGQPGPAMACHMMSTQGHRGCCAAETTCPNP